MQRFDYSQTNEERLITKMTHEHFSHVQAYLHASMEDKYQHYVNALRVWRRLVEMRSTSEAHRLAINYARNMGLVRADTLR